MLDFTGYVYASSTRVSLLENFSDPKTQASFVFFFRKSFAEEFCNFDGRSGLPTVCISAMILVALQNNSLIDVLYVKFIFSVFIFP